MRRIASRLRAKARSLRETAMLRKRSRRFREDLRSFEPPYKLHLGSGHVRLEGWINLDHVVAEGVTDLVWDFSDPFPMADGSCSHLHSEHVVEHLPVEVGVGLFREGHRLLQDGGVLRCAMPSLDVLIDLASTNAWREQEWLRWPKYQFIETRAEMLNIAFRWWGHQWLYDREELHRRLREAGFSKIRDVEWGASGDPELRALETRRDSLLICEAEK